MKSFPLIVILLLSTGLFNSSSGQKIFDALIMPADVTFMLYKTKKNLASTKLEIYNCSSSNMNEDLCECKELREYDKQGHLVSITVGDDIKRNKIDYKIRQLSISDSSAKVAIDYTPDYLRTIFNEYSDTSEEKRILKIQSVIDFDTLDIDIMPKKVSHYNLLGKPLSVYYPRGLRKPMKEFNDTLFREFGKIISHHQFFVENECHAVTTYTKENKIAEDIWINDSYSHGYVFIKAIYFYDSSGNLSSITHTNQYNQPLSFDRFFYKDNKQIRSITSCNSDGLNCYEEKIYDANSNIVEERDHDGYRKNLYNNGLIIKTNWYDKANKFLFSEVYKYIK